MEIKYKTSGNDFFVLQSGEIIPCIEINRQYYNLENHLADTYNLIENPLKQDYIDLYNVAVSNGYKTFLINGRDIVRSTHFFDVVRTYYKNPLKHPYIDVCRKLTPEDVSKIFVTTTSIMIKGIEFSDFYEDNTLDYFGVNRDGVLGIRCGYKNITDRIPKEEINHIMFGDGYKDGGYADLIPKKYIEKIILNRRFVDKLKYMEKHELSYNGEEEKIILDLKHPDPKIMDLMLKTGIVEKSS